MAQQSLFGAKLPPNFVSVVVKTGIASSWKLYGEFQEETAAMSKKRDFTSV